MVNVGKYTIYGCVMGFDTWSWLLVAVVLCVFFACKECHCFFLWWKIPNLNTFQIFGNGRHPG